MRWIGLTTDSTIAIALSIAKKKMVIKNKIAKITPQNGICVNASGIVTNASHGPPLLTSVTHIPCWFAINHNVPKTSTADMIDVRVSQIRTINVDPINSDLSFFNAPYVSIIPNQIESEKKICHAAANQTFASPIRDRSTCVNNANHSPAPGNVIALIINKIRNKNGKVAENHTTFQTELAL